MPPATNTCRTCIGFVVGVFGPPTYNTVVFIAAAKFGCDRGVNVWPNVKIALVLVG